VGKRCDIGEIVREIGIISSISAKIKEEEHMFWHRNEYPDYGKKFDSLFRRKSEAMERLNKRLAECAATKWKNVCLE